ncbi:MAG TPA: response regulator [Candidatus Limenecus avicola]|jgi:response regulator receiver domain|uniref:Stage 0 sporulation protein A homolog n=1 Tax=Candidatus Limenecus avicola TaxID=2840847 RepID=A0A9D1N1M2_9CLOT|nr:response regulator [Candidatus Limenecus avicola]
MSEENQSAKRTIEVDTEFLESLYGLVGKIPPGEKGINVDLLKDLILDIKRKMEKIKTEALEEASAPKARKSDNIQTADEMQEEIANEKAVLIVDDLGVITYQLGVMFRNLGYDVTIAKEIYDAITKYKKQMFKLVIMDLFIPTDREGFLLLDELVKLSKMNDCQTVIGVMTASSKREHRQLCMKKGADFYIEKVEDWQQELIDYCEKN